MDFAPKNFHSNNGVKIEQGLKKNQKQENYENEPKEC
jgi:hypothetical protein